jgi:hypothetical protein
MFMRLRLRVMMLVFLLLGVVAAAPLCGASCSSDMGRAACHPAAACCASMTHNSVHADGTHCAHASQMILHGSGEAAPRAALHCVARIPTQLFAINTVAVSWPPVWNSSGFDPLIAGLRI